jgi:AcrR family transcriptional regulator
VQTLVNKIKSPRKAGSTTRRAGEVTRERMLDAAEELFATHGFHGTSLRDVAREVEAPIALVTYHFVSKDNLFDRVIERRASSMAVLRLKALDEARGAAGDGMIPLEQLIEGYVWPFIERSTHGGPGWKNYSQLVARLANSLNWTPVISKHYDAVARQYLAEFRRSLPKAREADIFHAFSFMVGTMVATVAEPGRVENLSLGKQHASDLEGVFKVMVPFLTAGFRTIDPR